MNKTNLKITSAVIAIALIAVLTPSASADLKKSEDRTCSMDDSTNRPKAKCGDYMINFPSKWETWEKFVSPEMAAKIDVARQKLRELNKAQREANRARLKETLRASEKSSI